jgi:hypothetical protein
VATPRRTNGTGQDGHGRGRLTGGSPHQETW